MAPLLGITVHSLGSELEVEPEADGVQIRLDGCGDAADRSRGIVEAVVQVLDAGTQVLGEHMLDTAAGDPAKMRVGKARGARCGLLDVGPGRATRTVEQRTVAVEGDAGAAAHRGQPIELVAAAGRAAIDPGA